MKSTYIYIALVILIVGGLIVAKKYGGGPSAEANGPYDTFAQCLTDKGVTFYGAFWCPHCQAQKKVLQNSKKLPYVECSTPDGKSQTPICIEKNITGYPTWDFADGSRIDKEMTIDELSEKTECVLPSA
jgi:glutaredoxin